MSKKTAMSEYKLPPFHLAYLTNDLNATAHFFETVLQCRKGRFTESWVDFDFFGHQLSLHQSQSAPLAEDAGHVDGQSVPMPHFGVVLAWQDWLELAERLEAGDGKFRLKPQVRFEGEPGEQGTFFVDAPGAVALEFKAFKNIKMLFSA